MLPCPPVVLCLSGHDPTGGAGLQADIEALRALHCHPATVVTALTMQDTCDVKQIYPQNPKNFLAQARCLTADLPVAVIKIGLLGSADIAEAVVSLVNEMGPLPVVLDPILAAGGGHSLASDRLMRVLVSQVIPRSTVVTPNTPEARRLSGRQEPDDCASALRAMGCPHVVLTGAHEDGQEVVNRWYSEAGRIDSRWPRLPESYHGSGCTLAAALAAGLAQGLAMAEAVALAQRFTWEALRQGYAVGRGQRLPQRGSGSYSMKATQAIQE
jgi:hydroxymethylpyrimidine/phosphomethylpyrimidine kinase